MVFKNFLAPIHNYSDIAFRLLCQGFGAEAVCVPLVSCSAIVKGGSGRILVDAHPHERNIGVQLVDNEPVLFGKAARKIADAMPYVSWYNINCGCPSARTMGHGGGGAMLRRPERIVEALGFLRKAVDAQVSVKIRISGSLEETSGLCRALQDAGADFIIVHGRKLGQGYCRNADWAMIKAVRERLAVPVVGNGDIISAMGGRRLVEGGYCDAYMVGRAAMRNPMLFSDRIPSSPAERFALLKAYIALYERYTGTPPLGDVKLKAFNFTCGLPWACRLRNRLSSANSIEEILSLGEDFKDLNQEEQKEKVKNQRLRIF